MLYFSNLDYPPSGNNLTVKHIQTSQRKSTPHYAAPFPILCRLLAILLALAVAAPVLHAQDRDDITGRRRSNQGLNRLSRPSRSRARNVNRLPITWISTLTFAPQSAIRSVAGILPSPEKQRTPYPMSRPSTGARCASVFGKHCGILILNSINLSSIEASSGGNIIRFSGSSFTEIALNLPAARKLS